jgi:hypothetical protein
MKNITLGTYLRKPFAEQATLLMANSIGNPFHYTDSCDQQQFYNPINAASELPSPGNVDAQGVRLYPPGCHLL